MSGRRGGGWGYSAYHYSLSVVDISLKGFSSKGEGPSQDTKKFFFNLAIDFCHVFQRFGERKLWKFSVQTADNMQYRFSLTVNIVFFKIRVSFLKPLT